MLHSSYKSLGGVEGGAETVVTALRSLVEPSGGAAFFPRYGVRAWCDQHYWDRYETPGEMGIIPEVAARQPGAWRTAHPIHSFCVLGEFRTEFQFDNRSSFSEYGPFGLFHRQDGLVISFGVDFSHTFSMVHYVEQQEDAPWRREKAFCGIYVDGWQDGSIQSYRMSVRAEPHYVTDVEDLYNAVLIPRGVVSQARIGNTVMSWFRCRDYYDLVAETVASNPAYFYREEPRWTNP